MRSVLSRVLLAAVLVATLTACGCPVTKVREAAARTKRMNSIKIIGLAYHNYVDDNKGQPPQQAADLVKYSEGDPQVHALLTDGSFVFLYGVPLADIQKGRGMAQTVLGYDKAVETDKGIVLMADGSTVYTTAADFKNMTKAAPAKK